MSVAIAEHLIYIIVLMTSNNSLTGWTMSITSKWLILV